MPIQTTYPFFNQPLLPGMVASLLRSEAITAFAATAIPFGVGLLFTGTTDIAGDSTGNVTTLNNYYDRLQVALPASGNPRFAGVAGHDHTQTLTGEIVSLETLITTQIAQYPIGAAIKVIKKGRVAVLVDAAENPAIGDPVFLRHTANGVGTAVGQFRTTADTARALDVSTVAKWATVAIPISAAYKYALIDLDIV